MKRLLLSALMLALLANAAPAWAATQVTLTGDQQQGPVTADVDGRYSFVNVPLRRNAVNRFDVTAKDLATGQTQTKQLSITQLSLNSVVVSRIRAEPLSVQEIEQLVADGVIDIDDPANFNVSKFDIVLTIGREEVPISIPIVAGRQDPTGYEIIPMPRGDGGGNANPPNIEIVIFEVFPPGPPGEPPPPPIPGVLIIEGRIKTLKEFYSVRLLLMNTSGIFTLSDVAANMEFPDGGLTNTLPADGVVQFGDILPGDGDVPGQKEREFIVRGDEIGIRRVRVNFGGTVTGPGIPEDEVIPFNGSAETTVEVKGPPEFRVQVIHPPSVVAFVPYEFVVDIGNVGESPALYTSFELEVGADGQLIECTSDAQGEPVCGPITGAAVRNIGHLLPGQNTRQVFTINPLVSGPITSCFAIADQNIDLRVAIGNLGCLVGESAPPRSGADGSPAVTVLPTPNALGVGTDSPVTAFFSEEMNQGTITTGENGSFNVYDEAGARVPGQFRFVSIGGNTIVVWQVNDGITNRLHGNETYTVQLGTTITDLSGFPLAAPWTSTFTTTDASNDITPPALSLAVEPPVNPNAVIPGQLIRINAAASDQGSRVDRVELYKQDTDVPNDPFVLIDQKAVFAEISEPVIFAVDSANLAAGHTYQFKGIAFDHAGNAQDATLPVVILPGAAAPTILLPADPSDSVLHGISVTVTPESVSPGVTTVNYFLDSEAAPFKTVTLSPFSATLPTLGLPLGPHTVRAVAVDGLGQTGEDLFGFNLAANVNEPVVDFGTSVDGAQYVQGSTVAVNGNASDPTGIESVKFFLDSTSGQPIFEGSEPFILETAGLPLGSHAVIIQATNRVGISNNTANPVANLVFQVVAEPSGAPPASPTVTNVAFPVNGETTVTGTSVPGARIDITNTTQGIGSSIYADGSGVFAATLDANGGDTLSLTAFVAAQSQQPSAPAQAVVPNPPVLDFITVSPTSRTFTAAGEFQDVSVTAHYLGGSTGSVTALAAFSSSAPGTASVNAAGRIAPQGNGSATITASYLGKTAQVAVTVDVKTLLSIAITPSPVTIIGTGNFQQLTLTGTYSDSTTAPIVSGTVWSTSDASKVLVSGSGLITSTGFGQATITAAVSGAPQAQVLVTVQQPVPVEIVVSPSSVQFTAVNQTQALDVRYRFNDNTTAPISGPIDFSSRDTAVATVSAAGLVTAVANGAVILDVSAGGLSATVNVVVAIPSQFPPPEITALQRPIAGEGDTLVILGRYFAALPADNLVTVNGVQAQVIGASGTRLIAIVPKDAASGPVQVTVDSQTSNTVNLDVYARRALGAEVTGAFDLSPASSGQSVNLGGPTLDVRTGDKVFLSGYPDTIIGSAFSGLPAPQFQGRLFLSIDAGAESEIAPSATPVDLSARFTPGVHEVSLILREQGGQLSSGPLYLVNGPANTGPFSGIRSLTADTLDHTLVVRFRNLGVPDGGKVAVTVVNWENVGGSCCNSSAGGAITDGTVTPNDSRFKTFTVANGEIAVTYSDNTLLAQRSQTINAVLSVTPADAAGNRTASTVLAAAVVPLAGIDSASIIPAQTALLADGVDRPMVVTVNSMRDAQGNRVPDGARIALTAVNWENRDGSCCNSSVGGGFSDGITAPNDSRFKVFVLSGGQFQATFSAGSLSLNVGDVRSSVWSATVANAANNRQTSTPFSTANVTLSSPGGGQASITTLPSSLVADTADNRSVVTVSGLTDAGGNPVPDGTKVAVTTVNWENLNGSCCNGSAGGTIVGGVAAPNDSRFKVFPVTGGQIVFEYSDQGIVLDVDQTVSAVLSFLPADGGNNRIGSRPFSVVGITLAGIDAATVTPAQSSAVADGQDRPIPISLTGIRDALGNPVPDGSKIALTAVNWLNLNGGCCNSSVGGGFSDGITAPNDSRFKVYTVSGGQVQATFTASGIALSVGDVRQAIISAVVADTGNNRRTDRPFASGAVTLSSATAGTAQVSVSPASLLADTQARLSTLTVTGLTDSQGLAVPNGAKIAITAVNWENLDGSCCNGSAGGAPVGGVTSPSDSRFGVFAIQSAQLSAQYSDEGVLSDTGQTRAGVISLLPADGNNNRVGSRPLASKTVVLAGMGSATVSVPATLAPSAATSVTLSDIRDALGVVVPDGTKVALTAVNWTNPDGNCCNGSAGGSFTDGVTAPNDGRFKVYTVSGGTITAAFQAPAANNVTSVISAVSANASNSRQTDRPFAIGTIAVTNNP